MRLSQMLSVDVEEETNLVESNESVPAGYLQSVLDEGQKSSAANVTEDEMKLLLELADPAKTPTSDTQQPNDPTTQKELDELKSIAGI